MTVKTSNLLDAYSYKRDEIDIYSSSFGPSQNFAPSSEAVNEVFRFGVEKVNLIIMIKVVIIKNIIKIMIQICTIK